MGSEFKREIAVMKGGETIVKCIACGTCASACPVGAVEGDYDSRKIIRLVLLGERDEVLSSPFIWLCAACYSCQERCPQGVEVTNVIAAIQTLAAREGKLPKGFKAAIDTLKQRGRLTEVGEFENRVRKKLGCPEVSEDPKPTKELLENAEKALVHKEAGN